jgi:hypothetical protein
MGNTPTQVNQFLSSQSSGPIILSVEQFAQLKQIWKDVFLAEPNDLVDFFTFKNLFGDTLLQSFFARLFILASSIPSDDACEDGKLNYFQFCKMVEICWKTNSKSNFLYLAFADEKNLEGRLSREAFGEMLFDLYLLAWNYKNTRANINEFTTDKSKFMESLIDSVVGTLFQDTSVVEMPEFLDYVNSNLPKIDYPVRQYIIGTCFPSLVRQPDNESVDSSDDLDGDDYSVLPPVIEDVDYSGFKQVKFEITWLLEAMAFTCQESWSLLYSFAKDTKSFNRLCTNVCDYGGPILTIIRDSEGFIFGYYSTKPWRSSTDFREDIDSFLFVMKPYFKVYRAQRSDKHFYLYNSPTMYKQFAPTWGVGGKYNDFRLKVDESLEHGIARHFVDNDSYAPGQLASSEEFQVSKFEVWGCGGNKASEAKKQSILRKKKDSDKGKGRVNSQGIQLTSSQGRKDQPQKKPVTEFSDDTDD